MVDPRIRNKRTKNRSSERDQTHHVAKSIDFAGGLQFGE
jgi:hypothetical protein